MADAIKFALLGASVERISVSTSEKCSHLRAKHNSKLNLRKNSISSKSKSRLKPRLIQVKCHNLETIYVIGHAQTTM